MALVFTEMSIEFVLETPVDKFIMVDAETVSGGQNISATKNNIVNRKFHKYSRATNFTDCVDW